MALLSLETAGYMGHNKVNPSPHRLQCIGDVHERMDVTRGAKTNYEEMRV